MRLQVRGDLGLQRRLEHPAGPFAGDLVEQRAPVYHVLHRLVADDLQHGCGLLSAARPGPALDQAGRYAGGVTGSTIHNFRSYLDDDVRTDLAIDRAGCVEQRTSIWPLKFRAKPLPMRPFSYQTAHEPLEQHRHVQHEPTYYDAGCGYICVKPYARNASQLCAFALPPDGRLDCQAQGRRFDPDHPLSGSRVLNAYLTGGTSGYATRYPLGCPPIGVTVGVESCCCVYAEARVSAEEGRG